MKNVLCLSISVTAGFYFLGNKDANVGPLLSTLNEKSFACKFAADIPTAQMK